MFFVFCFFLKYYSWPMTSLYAPPSQVQMTLRFRRDVYRPGSRSSTCCHGLLPGKRSGCWYQELMAFKKKKKKLQTFYPNLTKWTSGISPRSRRQTWCVGNEFLGEFRHSDQTAAGLRGRHLAFVPHLSVITKTISGAEAPAALSRCQQVSKGIERVHF